jgi:type VI secretion system protein ImpC
MPDPIRPGSVSFDISFKKARASEPIDEDAPLRLVILGDFSARIGANTCRPLRVDCDNFDATYAQFGASLRLPPCAEGTLEIDLPMRKLDDFHPDQLLKSVPALAHLAQLRQRLLHPGSAAAAAEELRVIFAGPAPAFAAEAAASAPAESMDDTFARLLGKPKPEVSSAAAPAPASIVERLLKQAVSSTASAAPSTEQGQLLSMLDAELGARLRRILHHPQFQALEAAWRGLDFLVRESGDAVHLDVIDVTREELDRQLASLENPLATPVGRAIEQIAPAVILSAFSFGAGDTEALLKIARLAAACGTAFIAGADSALVGCASFGSQPNSLDWTSGAASGIAAFAELRRTPVASHLGLAMPRFLVRLPYGKESDSIETFPFEELSMDGCHECYLWASPAFLCGHRLINSFADDGWEMELGGAGGEIGGLPVHSFKADGEKKAKPCAEAWLSEKAADVILSHGFMPVLSVRGRDSVILVSLRSISEPASQLAFRRG